jgi:hypothetical protein
VEGIWQGLKVFELADVDRAKFAITNMKNIKRSTRSLGQVRGHRKGIEGETLLGYLDARLEIYLPSYRWVLEHALQGELTQLRQLAQEQIVILLDYETNCDLHDLHRPLSHAGLIKCYLEDQWPPSHLKEV